jgi:hypothetical protein
VGVFHEDVGTVEGAGAEQVLYGSASGLTATGSEICTQDSPGIADTPETSDLFALGLGAG